MDGNGRFSYSLYPKNIFGKRRLSNFHHGQENSRDNFSTISEGKKLLEDIYALEEKYFYPEDLNSDFFASRYSLSPETDEYSTTVSYSRHKSSNRCSTLSSYYNSDSNFSDFEAMDHDALSETDEISRRNESASNTASQYDSYQTGESREESGASDEEKIEQIKKALIESKNEFALEYQKTVEKFQEEFESVGYEDDTGDVDSSEPEDTYTHESDLSDEESIVTEVENEVIEDERIIKSEAHNTQTATPRQTGDSLHTVTFSSNVALIKSDKEKEMTNEERDLNDVVLPSEDDNDENYQSITIQVESASSVILSDEELEKIGRSTPRLERAEKSIEELYEEAFENQKEEEEVLQTKEPEEDINDRFSTMLDEMLNLVVKGPKRRHDDLLSLMPSFEVSEEFPKSPKKWNNPAEIASSLGVHLRLVSTEAIENNLNEIVPLVTKLLSISRRNKKPLDFRTMLASLSDVRILSDRIIDVKNVSSDSPTLKNLDLSWLVGTLCKMCLDEDSSVRPEASFTIAKLIKSVGPSLILRPIYFIIVMESGSGKMKSSAAKSKAAALDALTYMLISFTKDDIKNRDEICQWVAVALLNQYRRVRQSALECAAALMNYFDDNGTGLSVFRRAIAEEQLHTFGGYDTFEEDDTGSGAMSKPVFNEADINIEISGLGIRSVSAMQAIQARVARNEFPLPGTTGLIDYVTNIPLGKELMMIIAKMEGHEEDNYDFSSSSSSDNESLNSSKSIIPPASDYESDITMSKIFGTHVEKKDKKKENLMSADIAYVIAGKGPVFRLQRSNDTLEAEKNK